MKTIFKKRATDQESVLEFQISTLQTEQNETGKNIMRERKK